MTHIEDLTGVDVADRIIQELVNYVSKNDDVIRKQNEIIASQESLAESQQTAINELAYILNNKIGDLESILTGINDEIETI